VFMIYIFGLYFSFALLYKIRGDFTISWDGREKGVVGPSTKLNFFHSDVTEGLGSVEKRAGGGSNCCG
jgi:hypothetical protein